LIGLSVYLSYGYAKSVLGRKVARPTTTPGWLMIMGLGSFLVAIGILAVPHHATLAEISAEISAGKTLTTMAVGSIGVGLLLALVGTVLGATKKSA